MRHSLFYKKKVLVTAGPTREAVDKASYISHHSTGKMGYALAASFLDAGADVILVSGPVILDLKHQNLTLIRVTTALDMQEACAAWFDEIDFAIFTSAVADYRPKVLLERKIKREGDGLNMPMVKNPDIAFEFGCKKKANQFSVGFTIESSYRLIYALDKLYKKNLDIIILNSVSDNDTDPGLDSIKVTILNRELEVHYLELTSQSELARVLLNEIADFANSLELEPSITLVG